MSVREQGNAGSQEFGVVVVGLDDAQASHRAATWAAREATRRGATLQVITAWTLDALEAAPMAAIDPAAMHEAAEIVQREALASVVAALEGAPPVIVTQVLRSSPAEALVEASRHADLVVVGTHGRGPVRAMLLGSVSQAVVRHAACPVVVMPPVHVDLSGSHDLAASSAR